MIDFSSIEYIAPVIEEIKGKYYIENDSTIKKYFNCDLLLHHANSNNCIIVRHTDDFYISGIHALNKLLMQLTDYVIKVQTYTGELDDYEKNQEKKIYNAIRDKLIAEFRKD